MHADIIITVIGSAAAVTGSIYAFMRNFKVDVGQRIDSLDKRMDNLDRKLDERTNHLERKMDSMEERMFWMATGKRLGDAILEERAKRDKEK